MTPSRDAHRRTRPAFFHPDVLSALVERETRLRVDYRAIPEAPHEKARQFLATTAALMEFVFFATVVAEVVHRNGLRTLRDVQEHAEHLEPQIHALTNLQSEQVAADNAAFLERLRKRPEPSPDQAIVALDKAVSAAETIVRSWPNSDIATLAKTLNEPELGARYQVALDGLRRFIKRHDPWIDEKLRAVGPDYAQGSVSLEDVCTILDTDISDAVALLEQYGYARPLDTVGLSEEQRDDMYRALRASRQERQGRPQAGPAKIVRDVVATQRIEGIDARRWIDPKLT